MSSDSTITLASPLPKRRAFSLTPLADALFQVLVFFMLSGSLASYASLPLRNATLTARDGRGDPVQGATVEATETAVWTVGRDLIIANGQRFPFARLPALATALKAQKTSHVLLIARKDAQVQTITDVLEALTVHGITSVQIAQGDAR